MIRIRRMSGRSILPRHPRFFLGPEERLPFLLVLLPEETVPELPERFSGWLRNASCDRVPDSCRRDRAPVPV